MSSRRGLLGISPRMGAVQEYLTLQYLSAIAKEHPLFAPFEIRHDPQENSRQNWYEYNEKVVDLIQGRIDFEPTQLEALGLTKSEGCSQYSEYENRNL